MRLEQDRISQIRQWIYITSSAILFITWCLSLAALTQKGSVDGRLGWVFGLCFLTIPMVIYQSLTPMWSRTARFSNPHAHCVVDGFLSIFWFSAWVSLASYVLSGKGKGAKTDATGCDNFSHGSASKCKISEADIIFSVILMLCFVATSFFSFKVLMEYRRTGVAPNTAFLGGGGKLTKQDISYPSRRASVAHGHTEDDEAFDSRLDVHEDGRNTGYSFDDARVHGGVPGTGGYGNLGEPAPYAGYSTVPGGDDGYGHGEYGRPISFGGPLGASRV